MDNQHLDAQRGGHFVPVAFHSNAQADQLPTEGRDTSITDALTCSQNAAVAYALQAGAVRQNPLSGPDGAGFKEEVAYTLEARAEVQIAAVSVALRGRDGGAACEVGDDAAFTLRASQGGGDKPHVLAGTVRRLTPRECERLQGFPDDYTAIPWRGKDADQCPDGPRYKALGNSMAVPVMRWIGERVHAIHPAGFSAP